jgi:hypothetical protein
LNKIYTEFDSLFPSVKAKALVKSSKRLELLTKFSAQQLIITAVCIKKNYPSSSPPKGEGESRASKHPFKIRKLY